MQPERMDLFPAAGELAVRWEDGHESFYRFDDLRRRCPCAVCNERRQAGQILLGPAVQPLEMTPVGSYAVQFRWSDGHSSGIYTYDSLRDACRCRSCPPAARPASS